MLTLYTRPNCPLCEEAKLMLDLVQEDYPVEYKEVNIEEDEEVHEKYLLMIPVIERNGEVIIYGNIGYADILEALEF